MTRIIGTDGAEKLRGTDGGDRIMGQDGNDRLFGQDGVDRLMGGDGNDRLFGGDGNDVLEGGAGRDRLDGGEGDDRLMAFSWGGEPTPQQDANARVNQDEPLNDNDVLIGGEGADTFIFRWLIDAKDEILDKHRDASGNVDYSMNGVAGENGNVHDHWVETIGTKRLLDYDPDEGDRLVFQGHTVEAKAVVHRDVNGDGAIDSIIRFVSNQGGNGGAHDGDRVGKVIVMGNELQLSDIKVNAGVFFGVEDPFSAAG